MLWINLCAVVCLVLGFASGWWIIRKRRLPCATGDAIFNLGGEPAVDVRVERTTVCLAQYNRNCN